LPSFLIFEPSIERRQIDLQLPHDPILSEFDKNNKDKYFKFKLSTAKSLEGDASPSYLKVCEKAGDFFKGQNDPSNAMKYYGPAAVCLNKMGLVKSVELAELYIKEAECCVPLHYELAFQGDRLTEALDILRPTIEDAFGAVEYLRASCLMAQTDLALAALRDSSSSVRLNRAEVAFQNVVHVYDAYIAPKKELSPLYLVPTLSAAGDYFYRRARTAKDGDAVARSIKNSRRAFKGAIDQSEGNEQYISALISSWNRLGMVEMLARNYDEAILDLRNALRLLDKAREEPANARAVILSNLSDCYLSLKDYGNWLKIRLELARFGKTS
jgi:tetratricopeptide (TPR) repeat protein